MALRNSEYIRWFDSIRLEDVGLVGGKNASLGELTQAFRRSKVRVPYGFALTVGAYRDFLKVNHLLERMGDFFRSGQDLKDTEVLARTGRSIREMILGSRLTDSMTRELADSYRELTRLRNGRLDVAIRSSATAEDSPTASFAGQQDSFLNVEGERDLIQKVVECYASLFNDRAISYRISMGFDHLSVGISVGVQEMVRSDLGVSGVMFTLDPESGFPDAILINSTYGLGETLVKGSVNPDEFLVYKKTLESGFRPILKRQIGTKEKALVYDPIRKATLIEIEMSEADRKRLSLTDDEVLELGRCGLEVERHFSRKRDRITPMDIEWAKDGLSGLMYVVQARPETVHGQKKPGAEHSFYQYRIEEAGPLLTKGRSVGISVRTGVARVIDSVKRLGEIKEGEILVTEKTDPDWEPALKRVSAIVTERGGRTCHAAIIARELGIPAVVGTGDATRRIQTGEWITVSTAEGDVGKVYQGVARFSREAIQSRSTGGLHTRIMMNLGNSEEAFRLSFLPSDGVGLARMEFMISSGVKVHPMALLKVNEIEDSSLRKEILELAGNYDPKEGYYIEKLSEQIGTIAAAFYPRPVTLRMSDFKSNEYSGLLGGKNFEPVEENPMLGFRGAFRYSHPDFSDGFRLECEAVKRVRLDMGLTNLRVMIPFVRTLDDARKAIRELERNGLKRGDGGLEVWMMCEVPSNAILAEDFLKEFDGFSIGSNDLTQLVLGVDRDSQKVEPIFDERDPAVLEMIRQVIRTSRRLQKPISICGQAPSDHPDFVEFLIREGIGCISLSPDSVMRTLEIVETAEKREVENEK